MSESGAPLILLHGFLGDVTDFDELRAGLPGSIALPLPGHGGAALAPESTTQEALEALAARIEAATAEQAYTLVGYSLGGRLAAWMTALDLVQPERLVLIASSPGIPNADEREARLAQDLELADRLRNEPFREFLEQWYRLPLFGDLRLRENYPALLERRLRRDPQQVARALELFSVGRQPDLTTYEFEAKVLYLAGSKDEKYSALAADSTADRTAIIDGAGHAVHLENPAEVVRWIQEMEKEK